MRKVVKFGGSSLADSKQFEKVGNIISADESRLYVVPSAPGKRFSKDTKVTDMLIKAYEITVEGGDLGEQLKKIKARYDEIIDGLGLDLTLDDEFATIKENLEKDPYLDYASSRGEYLNGKVLANYLGFEFIDPYETIFFNEEGQLNDYKTNKVLKKRLEEAEHA
ncbi:MAG: aspartate kinase, partial [Ligilactobacillus ruminis]